jgi:drug/metabolite transporter (DMT)-like permease
VRKGDLGLLVVAVAAVSVSGPLIREAAAPALSIAAWRNVLAVGLLVVVVLATPAHRTAVRAVSRRDRRLTVLAGLLLAGHFATWVPSLALTTVASSVALVCTQPVWTALLARVRGEAVSRTAWWGIALSLAGVVVLSGVDLSVSGRALAGDALALAGGVLAAGYVTAGAEVRSAVPNPVYTLGCYAVAAVALLLLAGGTGQDLAGYSGRTWLVLAALAVGPQLLGHSVFNRLLPAVGTLVVSVAVLLEVLGASLLAWWWQSETPPAAAVPAALLLVGGVFLVVRARVVTSPIEPP